MVRAEHQTADPALRAQRAPSASTRRIIQWGGFTIGRAGTSYFDNPWVYAIKWSPNGSFGWPDTAGGRFVAAYTHQFGNGISGTLSLEDNKERKRGIYNGTNALTIALGLGDAGYYAGHRHAWRQHLA